jgi:hypothetical protein
VFAQLAQRMVSAVDMLVVHGMQEIHAPLRGAPVGTKLGGGRPGPWVICVVSVAIG